MNEKLKRIFIKGGIINPNELKKIIELARAINLKHISFGSRQDILFPIKKDQEHLLKTYFSEYKEDLEHDEYLYQNIVSSYVCADIFPNTSWLNSTTYLYIQQEFKYTPTLKINIVDPEQDLVPLYSGQLNFIASKQEDYWHLNLNLPGWEDVNYPALVYSWDLAKIAEKIEQIYKNYNNVEDLYNAINQELETSNKVVKEPLSVPYRPFPYYEGMNKMGISQYWLGLYWRNNQYDINFLDEFCDFCTDYKISRICVTPWKSLIVKGIERTYKFNLEKFLGQRGINIRHSSLELNWHLPVENEEALKLKRFIVKSFDQNDTSTYGLTVGYHERKKDYQYFTSMIIEKNPKPEMTEGFENLDTYNVMYCENFDPNTKKYITYAQNVEQIELPGLLMKLSQLYFEQLDNSSENVAKPLEKSSETFNKTVYQCKECLSVYDEELGDEIGNIPAETKFEDLPEDYCCSLCGASKSAYAKVELSELKGFTIKH